MTCQKMNHWSGESHIVGSSTQRRWLQAFGRFLRKLLSLYNVHSCHILALCMCFSHHNCLSSSYRTNLSFLSCSVLSGCRSNLCKMHNRYGFCSQNNKSRVCFLLLFYCIYVTRWIILHSNCHACAKKKCCYRLDLVVW